MRMRLSQDVHPEAQAELFEAARWYEQEQSGLSSVFLSPVTDAVHHVLDWPNMAPVFPGWDREPIVRSKSIKRFPFQVLYYLTETELRVVAFAHNRRKPGYWQDRL